MNFKLPDDLYGYQKEDLDRLLSSDGNFLNLSEMGTGKTPVSIGLAMLGGFNKTLVLGPKTLRLEWARQIADWTSELPTVSKRGSSRRLDPLFAEMVGKDKPNPWFILNYETLRIPRHLDILQDYPFDLIIMDEAHRLRNYNSQATKGMFRLLDHHRKRGGRVVALTGSPIVNNPLDLHTLLLMAKPEEYFQHSRMDFINKYCYYWRTRRGIKITGLRNAEELRQQTASFTIRRTKKEALPWLPEKYHKPVPLEMEDEQRELYDQMEEELWVLLDSGEPLYAASVLAQITRLRQLNLDPKILGIDCPSAKTDYLFNLIEDTPDKLVIFTTSDVYAQYLHSTLPYGHIVITGQTPADDRVALAQKFQNDPDTRLAIGTMKCMGEGLTLTAASDVILMDKWWAPSVHTQAEDRLHRPGAKNAVQVITPTIEDSIDSSMDKVLEGKRRMSDEYLGDEETMREVVDDLRRSRKR